MTVKDARSVLDANTMYFATSNRKLSRNDSTFIMMEAALTVADKSLIAWEKMLETLENLKVDMTFHEKQDCSYNAGVDDCIKVIKQYLKEVEGVL